MRTSLFLALLLGLAACSAPQQETELGIALTLDEGGDPTGKATRFTPWPGPGPLDPAVIALLPQGVTPQDVRLGSDGCYYYETAEGVKPVRWDDDPTHFYCIG